MAIENGNGELRQLLEIKRAYRKGLEAYETELKARYERELAEAKKQLKEQYLENVVDPVFAEPVPVKPVPEVAPPIAPAEPESPKCPDCGAPVDPTDKFCAECAFPVTEKEDEKPVAIASSRKWRTRVR